MSFLRSIAHDLREKRLWPLAVVLLIALIAAPVALSRGGGGATDVTVDPGVAVGAAGDPSGAALRAEVALDKSTPSTSKRPGDLKDPFRARRQATTTTAAAAPSVAAPSSSSSSSSSPPSSSSSPSSSGGSSSGSTTSPAPATPSATRTATTTTTVPKPKLPTVSPALRTVRTDLSFGETGAVESRPNVMRLAPLPNAAAPLFIFLGMREDTASAVFLLSGVAVATGEGTCVPRPGDCQALELPVGGTEYLDVTVGATTTQYQLEVPKARVQTWETARAAKQVRGRTSQAGLQVIRDAIATREPGLAFYRYKASTGLLKRLHPDAKG